ncbi:BTB/POZ and MATH domain-containing protein 2-like [Panicum miliaceum]|uniref:BTB/POZ and MATH domain-containing protein 2-like n=1 Tax=Panicum miliaceum TaxID=4540 RepID=A0A3L6S253_PANMI|nr:BTB/POZ and MATH domain-containing protein 2-like [Panicum miliaceum]
MGVVAVPQIVAKLGRRFVEVAKSVETACRRRATFSVPRAIRRAPATLRRRHASDLRGPHGAARSVQLFKISGYAAIKDVENKQCILEKVLVEEFRNNKSEELPCFMTPTDQQRSQRGGGVVQLPPAGSELAGQFIQRCAGSDRVLHVPREQIPGFFSHQEERPGARRYVKDDSILVLCAINVLEPRDAVAAAAAVASVPSPDLHQHFGELLRSQKGADITFLVAGEHVAAHRSVLAARSPVFIAELFGDMKEKASPCVEINDMEVEVFRTLLYFIYTDTAPELEQEGEQATLMAQHLLEAAGRYGLERLKRICVEKVYTDISVDTVASTLALAEQHGCSELKSRCMKFILATPENLQAVAATYKHLEASCPSVLTELLKLIVVKGNK